LNSLFVFAGNVAPMLGARKGVSTLVTFLLIAMLIVVGVAFIIVFLLLPSGPASTTTIYP